MQTWDSIYWLFPKTNGIFIKTKYYNIGLSPEVFKLDKLFLYSKLEHGKKLFDRVKSLSIIFFL